jgi:hypothetical protein
MVVTARHYIPPRSAHQCAAMRSIWSALGLAVIAVVACNGKVKGENSFKAGAYEVVIREVIPTPFRCSRTLEPLFYCRHENPPGHSMVLDLYSNSNGVSASLTCNYDDLRRQALADTMRHFFLKLGIPAEAYDACISRAEWKPESVFVTDYKILCLRVELGDRVTHEILVMPSAPTVVHAGTIDR